VGVTSFVLDMITPRPLAADLGKMTSERAKIRDPQVRELTDGVIDAQLREIEEMKHHIARLEANPPPASAPPLPSYRARHVPPPPPRTGRSTGIDTPSMPR
jgi:uncharacterized protein (DUF305 family)